MQTNNSQKDDLSFIEHLEELRKMLLRALFALCVFLPPGLYLAPKFLNFLTRTALSGASIQFHYFFPMEVFIIQLKTGFILAFLMAMPYITYEIKKFIFPALYKHEKKLLTLLLMSSIGLFFAGVFICIFFILPLIMNFSLGFQNPALQATVGFGNFTNLAYGLILAFGIMFQFPILTVGVVKFGIVEIKTLKNLRPYVFVGILILSALLTPPDIVSQLILGIPVYLLFEAGLFAAKFFKN